MFRTEFAWSSRASARVRRVPDRGGDAEGREWVRTFRDGLDREWEVRAIQEQLTERRTRLLPRPELAQGWLLFTRGAERRRLDPLPPGWSLASDSVLCRWCDDANEVQPAPTGGREAAQG